MARRKGGYKEVIREKVVSLRLNEEEFLRLKANGLRDRASISRLIRERIADLIGSPAIAVDIARSVSCDKAACETSAISTTA